MKPGPDWLVQHVRLSLDQLNRATTTMVQQTAAPETIIRKWHAHIKEYEYCKAYCRYVCEIFVNLSNKMHVNFLFLP
jgi:hypothetical protein